MPTVNQIISRHNTFSRLYYILIYTNFSLVIFANFAENIPSNESIKFA